MNAVKCKAKVFRGYHYYPCEKKATKGEYCGTHDPVRIAERASKKDAAWKAEWDAKKAAQAEIDRKLATHADLLAALEAMVSTYVHLVNCGDCGNWNPEEEEDVIQARAALSKARGRE